MVKVFVRLNGKTESTEITEDTHEVLRDGAYLRNRPLDYYLQEVLKEYGELSEENILKYIDEKWVL